MAPKAKTAERVKAEAEAQRARVAALQYLAKTGAGPSQKEIAQQHKEREKWTNATSHAIQQRLVHLHPTASVNGAPTRDNTLEALAAQRAKQMLQAGGGSGVSQPETVSTYEVFAASSMVGAGSKDALPEGWKEAVDVTSGETYYWNEMTKQTSWDRPRQQQPVVAKVRSEEEDDDGAEQLEEGWKEVHDPQSGQAYYWNPESNETTWTKPVKKTVSLEKAREAKSKLDAILKLCGPAKTTSGKTSDMAMKMKDSAASSIPLREDRQSDGRSLSQKRSAADEEDVNRAKKTRTAD